MKYLSTLIFILSCSFSFSQTVIQGDIINSLTKEPIPSVFIINKQTNETSLTNELGQFSIQAEPNKDSLFISYLGFETQLILAQQAMSISLEAKTTTLNELVVSSNREQEARIESPIAISSISAQRIADNRPTTIDQVLNQSPGVNMVNLGNEQHTMSIRRPIDYGASYLYMEDGIPIRASGVFNHNALLEINMANVQRIEIIRGPASSLYGSEAIGGAINFISLKPTVKPSFGVSIQGNDIGYKRTDFHASNTFKKHGIRISGYYANQQDGVLKHSDFDKLALSLGGTYLINDQTHITWNNTLIDYYSDMRGSLDSNLFYSKSYNSNNTFTNRDVLAIRSSMSLKHYWNEKSSSTLTAYYRNNSIKQTPSYRIKNDFNFRTQTGDRNLAHGEQNDNSFNSFGFIGQHKQQFDWLNSSIVAGVSVDYSPNQYEANYISIFKDNEGVYQSYTKTDSVLANYRTDLLNTAAYLKGKISPIERLNIIGGLRYDQFNYQFDNKLDSNAFTGVLDGNNTFSKLTPKLGVTYDYRNKGAYFNYSLGYVPPQVGELYRGNKIPSLKPVDYTNVEFGTWFTFNQEKGKIEVSVYQMDGRNEIISVLKDDGSTERQNAGETTHKGIEYSIQYQPIRDLVIRFSGTNATHKFNEFEERGNDYEGKTMPQAPEWIANAQISYKPHYIKGLRASLEWQHVQDYFMNPTNTKKYEGYDLLNARLGYRYKSFEMWVNVLNATDELYATVARATSWGQSYSLGMPRNFNIGLAYTFNAKSK